MVDWKNPRVMALEALDFNNVVHVFCGLYVWEIIVSFYFEISLIRGKRKVGWPLVQYVAHLGQEHLLIDFKVPFFLCRYGMLWALIGLVVSLNVSTKVDCGALYTFISVAGNTTIASASTSLMIRTIALWEWRRWVTVTICVLSLGQWGILIRSMNVVNAIWDETTNSCIVDHSNHLLLNLNYFYTMSFDFVILMFTTIVLGRFTRPNEGLSGLLFRDGLIYFLVTSMCNTVPAVLNLLDLNDEMNVIATVPAATLSAVAACRAVIRLKEYADRSDSYPTLNFIHTITSRFRKSSVPQAQPMATAVSLDELGTSSTDPGTSKPPTYVHWSHDSSASVGSEVKKTTEGLQPVSPKDDPFVSVV